MAISPSTYGLTRTVLGKSPFIELSKEEFERAKQAKRLLVEVLGIEETFNLVLGNYVEYEKELLDGALDLLVYNPSSWSEFTGRIHDVNRRVINLLSACRSYLDQVRHFVSKSFGKDSQQWRSLNGWIADAYDSSLGYRAMEALRNFTQHRGLGVHHLAHSTWREGTGFDSVVRNALVPSIQPKRLAEEGGFKKSVLEELGDEESVVDLRPLMREYVVCIAGIHRKLRDLLHQGVTDADELFMNLIARYKQDGGGSALGLAAVEQDKDGQWLDEVQLFDDLIQRRKSLHSRTRNVPHIARIFTTNEPRRQS